MNETTEITVQMDETEGIVNMTYHQTILNFGSLGRELKVSPKANVTINKPGYKQEMHRESVTITIGIGNDHVADIIMSLPAWEALKSGAEIHITTTKEFKKRFL